jgi:hypothetical protein
MLKLTFPVPHSGTLDPTNGSVRLQPGVLDELKLVTLKLRGEGAAKP